MLTAARTCGSSTSQKVISCDPNAPLSAVRSAEHITTSSPDAVTGPAMECFRPWGRSHSLKRAPQFPELLALLEYEDVRELRRRSNLWPPSVRATFNRGFRSPKSRRPLLRQDASFRRIEE